MVTTVTKAGATVGISQEAVRKRRERDTHNGRSVDGQLWNLLNPEDTTEAATRSDMSHDQMESPYDTSRTPLVSASAQAQLDAFRDAILRPPLERIEALARDNGRLLAERDQARSALEAAISDRDRANQRLASDRALIDLVVAQIDKSGEDLTNDSPSASPSR